MLKKQNRLKSNKAYQATYTNNTVVSNNELVLYVGKEKNDKNCPTRVGFVVSKKVHKRATKRNKIKRLLRENIRQLIKYNKMDILNNYQSLIFIAKKDILTKNINNILNTILILSDKLAKKNI